MVDSEGERALMVCLDNQDVFSRRVSLAAHPRAKFSLALRLRAMCRQALPLGSVLHHRLCWQLLRHREEDVRNQIWRLMKYEGQKIWRASGREISEKMDSAD